MRDYGRFWGRSLSARDWRGWAEPSGSVELWCIVRLGALSAGADSLCGTG
jgi:hypothetical protein